MNSKQRLLAALRCSWSAEPLFIHRRIGIQSARSLFSSHNQQVAIFMHAKAGGKLFMGGLDLRKEKRPLAKWFTLREALFYRLLDSLHRACIIQRLGEGSLAGQPSAFWTL